MKFFDSPLAGRLRLGYAPIEGKRALNMNSHRLFGGPAVPSDNGFYNGGMIGISLRQFLVRGQTDGCPAKIKLTCIVDRIQKPPIACGI